MPEVDQNQKMQSVDCWTESRFLCLSNTWKREKRYLWKGSAKEHGKRWCHVNLQVLIYATWKCRVHDVHGIVGSQRLSTPWKRLLANSLCKLHPGQKIQYPVHPSSMSWTQHLEGCGHFSFRREVCECSEGDGFEMIWLWHRHRVKENNWCLSHQDMDHLSFCHTF